MCSYVPLWNREFDSRSTTTCRCQPGREAHSVHMGRVLPIWARKSNQINNWNNFLTNPFCLWIIFHKGWISIDFHRSDSLRKIPTHLTTSGVHSLRTIVILKNKWQMYCLLICIIGNASGILMVTCTINVIIPFYFFKKTNIISFLSSINRVPSLA